jgi:hypothetical protein
VSRRWAASKPPNPTLGPRTPSFNCALQASPPPGKTLPQSSAAKPSRPFARARPGVGVGWDTGDGGALIGGGDWPRVGLQPDAAQPPIRRMGARQWQLSEPGGTACDEWVCCSGCRLAAVASGSWGPGCMYGREGDAPPQAVRGEWGAAVAGARVARSFLRAGMARRGAAHGSGERNPSLWITPESWAGGGGCRLPLPAIAMSTLVRRLGVRTVLWRPSAALWMPRRPWH